MQRCLDLAKLGLGYTYTNPLVGSVIVHDNAIIGEGYHQKQGEPHAEVNAINSVSDKTLLAQSTIYVNLEPCAHFGKTPPCADLIIKHQFKRVIICNRDPFDKVDGQGIERLKKAGIDVTMGVLEPEGKALNKRFFTFHENHRPYVILKWAQTRDGFLDYERVQGDGKSGLKVTNALSSKLVHKWRSEEQSIMVGKNTAQLDNPSLNVRHWVGNSPIRIVLDAEGKLPNSLNLFSSEGRTIILGNGMNPNPNTCEVQSISSGKIPVQEILDVLYEKGVQSILIEGGTDLLSQFIKADLWDEARVYTSKAQIGSGVKAPAIEARVSSSIKIQEDYLQIFERN